MNFFQNSLPFLADGGNNNLMYKILYIKHSDITEIYINEIIAIKSAAWQYSDKSHREWLSKNLKSSDIHVFLYMKERVVAYLNLISIELNVNTIKVSGLGVGNVCAFEKGKSWGTELMSRVNTFIKKNNCIGLLFCKNTLIEFYQKQNWSVLEHSNCNLLIENSKIVIMYYSPTEHVQSLYYSGKTF